MNNHKLSTIIDQTPTSSPHSEYHRPLTPTSITHSTEDGLPYAIFSPSGGTSREYSWGIADVAEHSDLEALRVAIFDTHAKVSMSWL